MLPDAQAFGRGERSTSGVSLEIPREDFADWFELDADSAYILLVADVKREGGGA